jgi:hypothetical protein
MAAGVLAGMAAILLAAPAYAFQQQAPRPALTAEEAIARQEVALERSLGIGCRPAEEDEILVCAPLNRGGIPFPEEEGKRKPLIAGEPAGAAAAMAAGGGCCGAKGGLDVLKIGKVAGKVLGKIF